MINQLFMIGTIKKMPELDSNKDGYMILEVQRSFKNSEGIYDKDSFKCYLWIAIYKKICAYCKIGDLLAVKGRVVDAQGLCNIVLEQVILLNKTTCNS